VQVGPLRAIVPRGSSEWGTLSWPEIGENRWRPFSRGETLLPWAPDPPSLLAPIARSS